jgi:hypothetical protein
MCVVIMLGALMAFLSLQFILDVLMTVPSKNFLHSVLGISFTDRFLAYFVSTQRLIVYHHHQGQISHKTNLGHGLGRISQYV